MTPRRSSECGWDPAARGYDPVRNRRGIGRDAGYEVMDRSGDKALAIEVASIANMDRLLPNTGRVLQDNVARYRDQARLLRKPATNRAHAGRALVQYRGFVVSIDGEYATVRLTDDQGEEFTGQYPADELAAAGIADRDPFLLTTREHGGAVSFDIRPAPRLRLSPQQQSEISRRVDQEFADFSPDDDY